MSEKKIKYLFVMPRFVQDEGEPYMFPLGMAYVTSSLKRQNSNVTCLNLNVHMGDIREELSKAIEANDIDVIATGGLTPHFKQVRKILSLAKEIKPDIITVLGGGLITATPSVLMKAIPSLDIGMIAEGEETILELDKVFEEGRALKGVKGIIYRDKEGNVITNEERPDIEDLDSLPFPDYEGFEFEGERCGITICTSRSCPFNCSFCFHTCGKKYRARSLDNIFEEIDWIQKKYQIGILGILDELFSTNVERMLEFCKRIEPYHIKWSCQMRVDRINLELLTAMKKAGCISVSYGIESASNKVLESMGKHTTIEKVEEALNLTVEAGICPFGNLLLGEKADDLESFELDYEWYVNHPNLQLGFNKILVLPGSGLYKYAVQNGYIKDEVQYLEDEYYTINITKLNDEEYKKCVQRMDEIVATREYPLEKVQVERTKNKSFYVKANCPLCETKLDFETDDFLGLKNGECIVCGRNYTVNLYKLMEDDIEERLKKEWSGKNVLIWGFGEAAMRMINQCSFIKDENIFFADRNKVKQRDVKGKNVGDPEEILKNNKIDCVLIGTNAPMTIRAIKNVVTENYKEIKEVYGLNEYLNLMAWK